jgi:hypothetical protein
MDRVWFRSTSTVAVAACRAVAGGCWLALVLLAPRHAFAAHPLITDDTGTQGDRGRFQLELNGELSSHRRAMGGVEVKESARELAAIVSMGVLEEVDLVVGVPWASSDVRENGALVAADTGLGDTSVEVKWRFLEVEGFSLAVKPGLSLPTGNEERGFGNGKVSYAASLIATQAVGPFSFHLNGAYARNEYALRADRDANRSDIFHASFAAGVEVVKGLQVVANVGLETSSDRGSDTWPAFVLGGLVYSATEKLALDLGVKGGLTEPETDLAALAGVAWRF